MTVIPAIGASPAAGNVTSNRGQPGSYFAAAGKIPLIQKRLLKNGDGFTLIELVGVMVIIGVLSSIAAAKVFDTDTLAKRAALEAAVSDLNSRERLSWSQIKLSTANWLADDQVFAILDIDLGSEYQWKSVGYAGGALHFKGLDAALTRTASTSGYPGVWKFN